MEEPDAGRLEELLRALADDGFGTILGARPGWRAGLRRVARARGDALTDLLDRLYREQYPALVAYASRRLPDRPHAEDVVQRAFEKVWRRSPDPDELDNPAAYVATATRNEINRALRLVVLERARTVAIGPDQADVPAPVDVAAQAEERIALNEALAALPTREREAVVLRLQLQLSVEEAAQLMRVSTGAVKGYTHHGLRKLRARIDAH